MIDMFENIKSDAQRYLAIDGREQTSIVGKVFVLFFSYGFQATIVYRYGIAIKKFGNNKYFVPLFWVLNWVYLALCLLSKHLYGIQIDRDAEIGKGFYIGHFGGIKVARCKIGNICNIHQLTQIENDVVLGNNVWVGAHATVKSGVHIADHATVTVGATVVKSVESYCLVAGVPARTIKINFDNSSMFG